MDGTAAVSDLVVEWLRAAAVDADAVAGDLLGQRRRGSPSRKAGGVSAIAADVRLRLAMLRIGYRCQVVPKGRATTPCSGRG